MYMSKYKVAEGFAFTAGGVVYAEGDDISLEQFGGNKDAFSVACGKGMIIAVPDAEDEDENGSKTPPDDGDGGKGSQKTLEALTKKELEGLAAKLKIETGGKKKEEIIAAIKKLIADYLAAAGAATDEQVKEFALSFGIDVKDKTKDEVIEALTELQK
ncbi:Rho termination factor N-terminal domain-containing protein [Treponema lecithinolyticum]|uniref:Rho termination factor N-terminal domain-containing protein n=1 Tax=Treponema lecithinolyticum TaxID=53418 RepID=UPI0028EE1C54|nr:Rho termination factor N-terminal domain-containing protein [Treponema lecithinolyticum]